MEPISKQNRAIRPLGLLADENALDGMLNLTKYGMIIYKNKVG